nr:mucin-12-like [Dermacentor andersoni]
MRLHTWERTHVRLQGPVVHMYDILECPAGDRRPIGPCPPLGLLFIFSRRLPPQVDTIRIPVRLQAGPPGTSKSTKRRGAALTLTRRACTSDMQRLTKTRQPTATNAPLASSSTAAGATVPTLSTLNATSDVTNSKPAALPAAFLHSAHATVHIPATFNAVSNADSSDSTAASQSAFVASMSPTTKLHAVSDAKSLGPLNVSQPAAFTVAAADAAASIPATSAPDVKSCNQTSESQLTALVAAASTGSPTSAVLDSANSMPADVIPNVPSRVSVAPTSLTTVYPADDSSAEIDFTSSPDNDHNTPSLESDWSTAPSPPGSYAAAVKGPSVQASLSSTTIPSPSLIDENRSFDLRLTMLERHQREQQCISQDLQQQIHTLTQTLKPTTSSLTSQLTKLNEHLATFITPSPNAQVAPLADLVETTTNAHHTRLLQLETSIVQILTTLQTQSKQLESFASMLGSLQESLPPAKKKEPYSGDPNPDLDRPFTPRELEAALAANASRSAPGEDAITYNTLRNLPDHSKEFLLQTFNNAWDSGCLPSTWTSSLTSMIPKPGKPPSLSNLRPISLTSCVGKTLERMALTRLSDFIDAREFFPHSLIGFRRCVCAQDMFLILQHTFLSPNPSQIHALVTVDVRKAFDGVCHDHILSQLSSLDCGNRMYSYLRSFLSNRVARFQVDKHLSDPHTLTRGTPQGAVLSPTLFNLAMTPLASQLVQIPDLHHVFSADDITLWCSSGSPGHVQDTLQRGLDLINSFLSTAGLSPAPEKSELLLLNYSSYQRSHNALISLHLSGSPIPIVPQCKVLGFPLHAAKNVQALHHAVRTCHSVTHLLRRVVTRRSGLHEAHACRVAHALALNKFLYFVPYVSFTHTQLNTLETALVGLYKAALNLPITTSTAKLFATGLFHPLRSLLSLPLIHHSLCRRLAFCGTSK